MAQTPAVAAAAATETDEDESSCKLSVAHRVPNCPPQTLPHSNLTAVGDRESLIRIDIEQKHQETLCMTINLMHNDAIVASYAVSTIH